jgi:hypothetical protein
MHRHWKLPSRSLNQTSFDYNLTTTPSTNYIHDSNDFHFSLSKFMSDLSPSRSPSPELSAAKIENIQLKAWIYKLENCKSFTLQLLLSISNLLVVILSRAASYSLYSGTSHPKGREVQHPECHGARQQFTAVQCNCGRCPNQSLSFLRDPHSLHSSLLADHAHVGGQKAGCHQNSFLSKSNQSNFSLYIGKYIRPFYSVAKTDLPGVDGKCTPLPICLQELMGIQRSCPSVFRELACTC